MRHCGQLDHAHGACARRALAVIDRSRGSNTSTADSRTNGTIGQQFSGVSLGRACDTTSLGQRRRHSVDHDAASLSCCCGGCGCGCPTVEQSVIKRFAAAAARPPQYGIQSQLNSRYIISPGTATESTVPVLRSVQVTEINVAPRQHATLYVYLSDFNGALGRFMEANTPNKVEERIGGNYCENRLQKGV